MRSSDAREPPAETLSHSTGLAHSTSDCVGYFESAGFETISLHEFIPNTLTRVTGVKQER